MAATNHHHRRPLRNSTGHTPRLKPRYQRATTSQPAKIATNQPPACSNAANPGTKAVGGGSMPLSSAPLLETPHPKIAP